MKRIISFICTLSLLLGCIPAEFSFASNVVNTVVNEAFENIATNGAPENIVVKTGVDDRVVEISSRNKALYARADGMPVKISVPIAKNFDNMVFSYDLMVSGAPVTGSAMKLGSTGSGVAMFTYMQNKYISLQDGMDIGGYPNGKWVNYTVAIDYNTNTYDLYIDNEKKFDNRIITTTISKPSTMDFEFVCLGSGDVAEIYMDNIRVYEGNAPLKDSTFPKIAYNSETLDFTPGEVVEEVFDNIYIDSVSKQGISSASFVAKDGTTAGWDYMEGDEVPYMHFTKTSSNDVYMDTTPNMEVAPVKYVWQMDVYVKNIRANFFVRASGDGQSTDIIRINSAQNIVVDTTTSVGKIDSNKWVTIAVACDTYAGTQDVYVDGKLIAEDVPVRNGGTVINKVRIGFTSGGAGQNDIWVNRIKFYDGLTLRTFEDKIEVDLKDNDGFMWASMEKTTHETEKEALDIIGKDIIFMTSNGKLFAKGKKQSYTGIGADSYMSDGKVMVDVKVLEYALGITASISNDKVSISGKNYDTQSGDGSYFVDVAEVGRGLGMYVYEDIREFVVLSSANKGYSNAVDSDNNTEPVDTLFRYMQFDKVTGDEIYETLKNSSQFRSHPRLFTKKEEILSLRNRISNNTYMRSVLNSVITRCETYLEKPPLERTFSGFRLFGSCNAVKERLYELCTVYLLTGDEKYAERAWLETESALNWEDWNLTTHFLDSGEIGPGMAYAYDVLYDYLTDEQKSFFREKIQEQYLDYCVGVFSGNSAYKSRENRNIHSNWGAVCGASMYMIAMTLIDEEGPDSLLTAKCKYIAENTFRTFQHICTMASPYGTHHEGIGYYEYVIQHLAWFLEVNDNMLNNDYNFLSMPGMREFCDYGMYYQTKEGSFNKGPTTGTIKVLCPETSIYAKLYNDPVAMGLYNDFRNSINVSTFKPQYLLFFDPEYAVSTNEIPLLLDKYYISIGTGISRGLWGDEEALYAAYSGGSISHYDIGSFIYEILGERWIVDIGRNGSNTMKFCYRSDVHSVLTVNPHPDHYGQTNDGSFSEMIEMESKPKGSKMVYDLTSAYSEWISEYKRAFLVSDERTTLTVRDEFTLKEPALLQWNLVTKADIEIAKDGKSAIFSLNDKKLRVTAYCSIPDWKFEKTEDMAPAGGWVDGEQSPKAGNVSFSTDEQKAFAGNAKRLRISVNGSGNVQLTYKLSPVIEGTEFEPAKNISIKDMHVPDGELEAKPVADVIYVDGKPLDGFISGKKNYTLTYPFGSSVPTFSATASHGTVSITQPSDFTDVAKITVTNDSGRTMVYTIDFNVGIKITDAFIDASPVLSVPDGNKLLELNDVYASHIPQPEHAPRNVIDGDFVSRWTSDTKGAYIEIDLGQVYDLSGVALAFISGDKRNYIFDILVSEDKMNYKRIYSGQSTGKTTEYEFIKLPVKARYVRYVGYQHTAGIWNSLSEFRPAVKE